MFPDAPVQELELIVKDSPDFDQALEVVLHRFGNKTPPHQEKTRNIPSRAGIKIKELLQGHTLPSGATIAWNLNMWNPDLRTFFKPVFQ